MTEAYKNPHAKRLLASVEEANGIEKLLAVMAALRDPEGGCPWDKQQSYQTILPFTIEEVYEVAETIETQDYKSLKDELGDLLFQVVFYAQIATEEERFEFQDIVDGICEKLLRRHPHVFANAQYEDEQALNKAWEDQKQLERESRKSGSNIEQKTSDSNKTSALDDIPKALPELKRAHKIQKRAAKVGFDWDNVSQVWDKVAEEQQEVIDAAKADDPEHLEEELGDLLFALVNLTRHYGVDADLALRKANHKFSRRFRRVEDLASSPLDQYSLDELEALWQQAKELVKNTGK